jgi:DNA-binding response OmpR family regulator
LLMPALDGQTLYGLLQQQHPTLCQRLIFLTGDTLGVDSQVFLAQCGLPWIAKPCRIEEIRATIAQVLSTPMHDTSGSTPPPCSRAALHPFRNPSVDSHHHAEAPGPA